MTEFINAESELHKAMVAWRRDFHAHPELAYEESRTSKAVADVLVERGLEVEAGIGETGLVATLKGLKPGDSAIALRADMDALPIQELNDFGHQSTSQGRMHACGHDGHTAMLLGAACQLAENADFAGTVHFVFQPAEEGGAGALRMMEDGLFDRYPADAVFALHNWPSLKAGDAAVHTGPVMAAYDTFEILISGQGGHAGIPNQIADPIVAAAFLVTAIQSIVSRNLDPLECGVISFTKMFGGDSYNVIPDVAGLWGTIRTLTPAVRERIMVRMRELVADISDSFDCEGDITFVRSYPATVNRDEQAIACRQALEAVPGLKNLHLNPPPSMASEDFSFMLREVPGCYIWLGSASDEQPHKLHSPRYDFNDDILLVGANYWISLVHQLLNSRNPSQGP